MQTRAPGQAPGLSESLGRRVTAGDLRDHRHDRVHLRGTLERIVGAEVSHHHGLADRCVIGAAEHINRLVGDMAGRIDLASRRLSVCVIDQRLQRDTVSAFTVSQRGNDAALSALVQRFQIIDML